MIQIDMPMPDNCLECRFNTSEFGYCNAMPVEFVGQVSDFEEDGKPEWCPLKALEAKEMSDAELMDAIRKAPIIVKPAVDAAPVVHARWKAILNPFWDAECSECGYKKKNGWEWRYCPACGARMSEG